MQASNLNYPARVTLSPPPTQMPQPGAMGYGYGGVGGGYPQTSMMGTPGLLPPNIGMPNPMGFLQPQSMGLMSSPQQPAYAFPSPQQPMPSLSRVGSFNPSASAAFFPPPQSASVSTIPTGPFASPMRPYPGAPATSFPQQQQQQQQQQHNQQGSLASGNNTPYQANQPQLRVAQAPVPAPSSTAPAPSSTSAAPAVSPAARQNQSEQSNKGRLQQQLQGYLEQLRSHQKLLDMYKVRLRIRSLPAIDELIVTCALYLRSLICFSFAVFYLSCSCNLTHCLFTVLL